jgi:hypothetical protein
MNTQHSGPTPEPDAQQQPAPAAETATPGRQDWRGLRLHFAPRHGFNLWYPRSWQRYTLPQHPDAVLMVGPTPHDGVLVELYTQPRPVGPDDLPLLDTALAEAVGDLPQVQVLEERNVVFKDAIGFEKVYTFLHAGEGAETGDVPQGTWKKWVRFLFKGDRQFNLIAQAASPEEFDRLRPDFDRVFESFEITYRTE